MMGIIPYFSVIILNINSLKPPVKRHRLAQWVKKHKSMYTLYKHHVKTKKKFID